MMRGRQNQWQEPLNPPPRDALRISLGRNEKLPTPLDDRGLVDASKLIKLGKSVIDPAFMRKSKEEYDSHHLYWSRNRYPYLTEVTVNPHRFRNLAINQILLPRFFHEVIHDITEEPPIPSEEVMYYQIEMQRFILAIFQNARLAKRLERKRFITPERLNRGRDRLLENHYQNLDKARELPEEFHLINFNDYLPSSADDMPGIAHELGKIAMRRTVNRTRDVYAAAS